MTTYFEWALNVGARHHVTPFELIDVPEYLVLEGEAAADTVRRHLTAEQRAALDAALEAP